MCIFIMATWIFHHLSNRRRHPHIIRFRDSFEEKVRGVGAKKWLGKLSLYQIAEAIGIFNFFFVLGERGAEKQDNPDFDS